MMPMTSHPYHQWIMRSSREAPWGMHFWNFGSSAWSLLCESARWCQRARPLCKLGFVWKLGGPRSHRNSRARWPIFIALDLQEGSIACRRWLLFISQNQPKFNSAMNGRRLTAIHSISTDLRDLERQSWECQPRYILFLDWSSIEIYVLRLFCLLCPVCDPWSLAFRGEWISESTISIRSH